MAGPHENLEHAEHAQHAAHGGENNKKIALIISVLALGARRWLGCLLPASASRHPRGSLVALRYE